MNINVLTFSSDSDSRYNSAMRGLSMLGIPSHYFSTKTWFSCGNLDLGEKSTFFVQDTPHLGSKMRNLMLKTLKNEFSLPFGKHYIQIQHLQQLVDLFRKDKHNLTPSIVRPIDRQNFEESVLRICDQKVIDLLRSSVVDCQATVKYLEIMRQIIEAFSSYELTPAERVRKMWYCVFMVRIWRRYIVKSKKFKLKPNFLSSYSYTCIELNAHSLVLIILHLRRMNAPHLFLPTLFSSQACENLFRAIRSFTSTFSTVTNSSVKETANRISKIQIQNDIINDLSDYYEFTRLGSRNHKNMIFSDLSTLEEIKIIIEKCKTDALSDAIQLGMITEKQTKSFDDSCKIRPYKSKPNKKKLKVKKSVYSRKEIDGTMKLLQTILLKDYSNKFTDKEIDSTSPYVEISSKFRKRFVVKKSALVWFLRNDHTRVSSDRLERVKCKSNNVLKGKSKYTKKHFFNLNSKKSKYHSLWKKRIK